MAPPRNLLTIDLEDWFHGVELPSSSWRSYENRVEHGTGVFLDLCDEFAVQATFFTLGCVAQACPRLIRRIASRGHEIGTHGHEHQFVSRMTPGEYAADLSHSIKILQDVTGQSIIGHRAPFFSINSYSMWAFEIMAENGILYDSSIFPIRNYRYGVPHAPRHPHEVRTASGTVLEIPISTIRRLGTNLCFTGGFYMRFFPYWTMRRAIRSVNREGMPAVIYLHPWELDPDHPRVQLPSRIRLTHYHNLRSTEPKLREALREFTFGPAVAMLPTCPT